MPQKHTKTYLAINNHNYFQQETTKHCSRIIHYCLLFISNTENMDTKEKQWHQERKLKYDYKAKNDFFQLHCFTNLFFFKPVIKKNLNVHEVLSRDTLNQKKMTFTQSA